jgi:hypothetical protein
MTCVKRWKLTNEAETHNGLTYHDGLNIDPLPFNADPSASCCPGGIYFAGRDILEFIEGMTWAREVSLPPDARVVLDPSSPEKWRADRVILGPRVPIATAIPEMLAAGADVHADNDYALRGAAVNGHLPVVQALLAAGADVHADNDYALCCAARNGHLPVVQALLAAGANLHARDDYALCCAVGNGHLPVVQALLAAGANLHADNDYALCWAARNGHSECVKLLKRGNP